MDAKTYYRLMSEIYFAHDSDNFYAPEELIDYFEKLKKKKVKTNYKYDNLDEFIETAINKMLKRKRLERFKLVMENKKRYIYFNIDANYRIPYNITFTVKTSDKKNKCVSFIWYPFNQTIYLKNLLYTSGKENKIEANKDCAVKDIPKKSGEFFLNLIEDLAKKISVKRIILNDNSTIVLEDKERMSLALYYLKKHGHTYYGKFGYKPILLTRNNHDVEIDIMLDVEFKNNNRNLNFVKKELKKVKTKDLRETLVIFEDLEMYIPWYYMKKI